MENLLNIITFLINAFTLKLIILYVIGFLLGMIYAIYRKKSKYKYNIKDNKAKNIFAHESFVIKNKEKKYKPYNKNNSIISLKEYKKENNNQIEKGKYDTINVGNKLHKEGSLVSAGSSLSGLIYEQRDKYEEDLKYYHKILSKNDRGFKSFMMNVLRMSKTDKEGHISKISKIGNEKRALQNVVAIRQKILSSQLNQIDKNVNVKIGERHKTCVKSMIDSFVKVNNVYLNLNDKFKNIKEVSILNKKSNRIFLRLERNLLELKHFKNKHNDNLNIFIKKVSELNSARADLYTKIVSLINSYNKDKVVERKHWLFSGRNFIDSILSNLDETIDYILKKKAKFELALGDLSQHISFNKDLNLDIEDIINISKSINISNEDNENNNDLKRFKINTVNNFKNVKEQARISKLRLDESIDNISYLRNKCIENYKMVENEKHSLLVLLKNYIKGDLILKNIHEHTNIEDEVNLNLRKNSFFKVLNDTEKKKNLKKTTLVDTEVNKMSEEAEKIHILSKLAQKDEKIAALENELKDK